MLPASSAGSPSSIQSAMNAISASATLRAAPRQRRKARAVERRLSAQPLDQSRAHAARLGIAAGRLLFGRNHRNAEDARRLQFRDVAPEAARAVIGGWLYRAGGLVENRRHALVAAFARTRRPHGCFSRHVGIPAVRELAAPPGEVSSS
jgi:hypothetical protein